MSVFPDVPPISSIPELKDFVLVNWFGLFTTAGTPTAIIDKLNAATVKALNDPEVIKTLETQGAQPSPTTPAEFGAFRTEQSELFGQIIKDRSEEHTSELQSLMRIPYAFFCLKTKNT